MLCTKAWIFPTDWCAVAPGGSRGDVAAPDSVGYARFFHHVRNTEYDH
jgi:hypothetical protein